MLDPSARKSILGKDRAVNAFARKFLPQFAVLRVGGGTAPDRVGRIGVKRREPEGERLLVMPAEPALPEARIGAQGIKLLQLNHVVIGRSAAGLLAEPGSLLTLAEAPEIAAVNGRSQERVFREVVLENLSEGR